MEPFKWKKRDFAERIVKIGSTGDLSDARRKSPENSEEVQELLWDIVINVPKMNKTRDVVTFVNLYDKIMRALQHIVFLGANPPQMREQPAHTYNRLKKEFQAHMRDAIDRSAGQSIENIKEKYNASEYLQKQEAQRFVLSINEVKNHFSDDTKKFAEEAMREVLASVGQNLEHVEREPQIRASSMRSAYQNVDCARIIAEEMAWRRQQMGKTPIEVELERIDKMDGHTFERWCANLLKASGLVDVEVTRGSGDQGVDVLATLDGVRYAVQCKCYSSDLGNKPVQEVFAGSVIYKCQVGAVMTNRHFTAGAKELATATGVSLWDRDWIISLLKQLDSGLFPL